MRAGCGNPLPPQSNDPRFDDRAACAKLRVSAAGCKHSGRGAAAADPFAGELPRRSQCAGTGPLSSTPRDVVLTVSLRSAEPVTSVGSSLSEVRSTLLS